MMKEEFLHYLWKSKRFENQQLSLADGRSIRILEAGYHNCDTGPDFFNGTIELDGLTWTGNIEIHIKSSDWIKHGHHSDVRYNNVVLHVVYQHDREIFIENKVVPVLELKQLIPDQMIRRFELLQGKNRFVPCAAFMQPSEQAWTKQMGVAIFQRLERKSMELIAGNYDSQSTDRRKQFLVAIAGGFGMKVNKLPFQELAVRLPLNKIIACEEPITLLSIVLGISGLLEEKGVNQSSRLYLEWLYVQQKFKLASMNPGTWKFGGVRPKNSPWYKLIEFCQFLFFWKNIDLQGMSAKAIKYEIYNVFDNKFGSHEEEIILECVPIEHVTTSISKDFRELVMINGVVPYLYYLKIVFGNFEVGDIAFELLHELRAEKNSVVKNWKKLGVNVSTAVETQALVEQKNSFCDQNRCMDCLFGQEFIENKEDFRLKWGVFTPEF